MNTSRINKISMVISIVALAISITALVILLVKW